jgi:serine/threonine protein kinase
MHNLHGGAIQKNPEKSNIVSMFDMLGKAKTFILLSGDSSYGFVCEFTVDEEHSEYTTMDGESIKTFILKLVVTSSDKRKLFSYNSKEKGTETSETFITEARMQHAIWVNSIKYGNTEICPDVIDALLLDYTNSIKLIKHLTLINTKDEDKNISDMLTYLGYTFKSISYGIGLIIMPKVMDSVTLFSYRESYRTNPIVYSNIIAQIVRLFIINGIIHLDLHSDNILINPNTLYCEIIDFGKILQIHDYANYRSRYEELKLKFGDEEKSTFMEETFDFIITKEKETQSNKTHLKWLKNICNPNIYLKSFITLVGLMSPPPRKRTNSQLTSNYAFNPETVGHFNIIPDISDDIFTKTIQEKKQKKLEEKDAAQAKTETETEAEAEAEANQTIVCSEPGMCTIMGGKRKTIKSKTRKKKLIKKKKKTYKKHTRKQK